MMIQEPLYTNELIENSQISQFASLNFFSTMTCVDNTVQKYLLEADKIDLSLVKARTMRVHSDWTASRADSAVAEYRKLLVLAKLGVHVVPGKDIDEIWHSHILFTKSYALDCDSFFGYYLHHKPADGSSAEDNAKRKISHTIMMNMYKKYFCHVAPLSWNLNYSDPCGSMGCDTGCTC